MSTASLCSSTLQSQISGLGSGLKLQRQNLSQPTSFTFTRYCFYLFRVLFSCEIFSGFLLYFGFEGREWRNLCSMRKPSSEMFWQGRELLDNSGILCLCWWVKSTLCNEFHSIDDFGLRRRFVHFNHCQWIWGFFFQLVNLLLWNYWVNVLICRVSSRRI